MQVGRSAAGARTTGPEAAASRVGAGPLASAAGRAVAWVAVMRGGLEGQRAGVDAIAPAGGGGPVAEDMAQMTAAAAADHLGAAQQPALVRPELDRLLAGRLDEARPASTGGELGVGAEQLIPAARAAVGAGALGVEVSPGEGLLGVAPAQHVILLAGQFLPPLLLGFADLGRRGGLRGSGAAHRRFSPGFGTYGAEHSPAGDHRVKQATQCSDSASRTTGQADARRGQAAAGGALAGRAPLLVASRQACDPGMPADRNDQGGM